MSRIQRILVALDASQDSLAALEAAADLAEEIQAELFGLFVEDVALLRADQLAIAREVEFFSAEPRETEAGQMERELRAQAKRVRSVLEQVAERRRVPWRFRRVRGDVTSELRSAAGDADLLALGMVGRSLGRGPGSTTRALLGEAPVPVLLTRRGGRIGRSVHLLYDGSEASRRALRVAAALAGSGKVRLTMSVLVEDEDEARDLWKEASGELEEADVKADFHHLPPREGVEGLAALLKARGCGLVVAGRPAVAEEASELRELLTEVSCPVLVVG